MMPEMSDCRRARWLCGISSRTGLSCRASRGPCQHHGAWPDLPWVAAGYGASARQTLPCVVLYPVQPQERSSLVMHSAALSSNRFVAVPHESHRLLS